MKRVIRKLALISGLLALLGVFCFLGFSYYRARPGLGWPRDVFKPTVWREANKELRFRYYRDLKARGILHDLSRKEVEKLLGRPDFRAPNGSYFTYILKYREPDEWTMNMVYILQIDFDQTGRVCRQLVRPD